MHPFETEPAILPDRVTTIFEPSGRGLEPHVSTTVASAMSSPAFVHSLSASSTSRITTGSLFGDPVRPGGGQGLRAPAGCGPRESHRSAGEQPPCRESTVRIPRNPGAGLARSSGGPNGG